MQPAQVAKPSKFGIAGLDELLSGGLPAGRFYLIEGEPGTGKTTVALQFLMEGRQNGERCLYITLSETVDELMLVAQSHGWDLTGIDLIDLSIVQKLLGNDVQTTVFHPSEVELAQTTEILLQRISQLKPARVVFDSLSEMKLLAQDPLRYRRQMLSLKQFFAERNCTVLMLDDQVEGADQQVRSIAHGVVRLERMPNEYGLDRRRIRVVKLRGKKFRGGFHDYVIETGGVDVFPRLIAAEHIKDLSEDVATSGIAELDKLVGGGLVRGTSNLLIGPAGSGKSSLANAFIDAALKRGERAVILSFDENQRTLLRRAAAIGFDFSGAVERKMLFIHQIDPAELSPGEMVGLIREAVEREGARMVLIDSLNGYLAAMPEELFLPVHLHEVLTYLCNQGVVSLLVMAQHGIIGTVETPAEVTYLADAVILCRFFETRGSVKKAISVVKKRLGSHEETIREYVVNGTGVRIGEPLADFEGILTGAPQFSGPKEQILRSRAT
jgi:circadian clock protein KaiC